MGLVGLLGLGFLVLAKTLFPLKYQSIILLHSRRNHLDPALIAAVIFEESKFGRSSRSSAGAVGLMQLMPETAVWASNQMGRPGLADKITEPPANIALGSWYYRYLLDRYGDESLALAAYNGGQRNLDKWLAKNSGRSLDQILNRIPFAETRSFVRRVRGSRIIYYWLYSELR